MAKMISTTNWASAVESGDVGFFFGEGSGGGVVAASDGDVMVVGGRVIACRFDTLLLAESRLGFGCSWEEIGFARRLESVAPVSESWS